MSLRVLYLLNISNPDRLAADSGWIFADLLAPALADVGVDVTVAAPAPVGDARCGFERTAVPGTKYRARFAADVDELADLIRRRRPGVVVANQIEAAPAVRTALMEARSGALLAGYCHYLPFTVVGQRLLADPSLDAAGLGRSVLLAFAAGLAACDRVMVHSRTAATWTRQAADGMGVELGERLRVVPAPRDQRLVRDPVETLVPCGGELVGVYNHRLYAHYGTARFVCLARRLTAEVPVRLRVMDLFGTRNPGRVRLDGSPEQLRDELAALPGVEIASRPYRVLPHRRRYHSVQPESLPRVEGGLPRVRNAGSWQRVRHGRRRRTRTHRRLDREQRRGIRLLHRSRCPGRHLHRPRGRR